MSRTTRFEIRPERGVLIVDTQGLGDVVCSLPLVKAVCRWSDGRWPVHILLHSASRFELIQSENLKLSPFYMQPSYGGVRGFMRLLAKLRGKIDLVIGIPEVAEKKLVSLRYALGAKYLLSTGIGQPEVAARRARSEHFREDGPVIVQSSSLPNGHWTSVLAKLSLDEQFLESQEKLASQLGIPIPLPLPKIKVEPLESDWADSVLRSAGAKRNGMIIGLHCASAVPVKTWPPDKFGVVVQLLRNRFPDLFIVSFGSKIDRLSSEQARLAAGPVRWLEGTGEWNIRQVLAILSRCDLFISADTGLMHMAAAVGVKTVSVFGKTLPIRRAPLYSGGLAVFPRTACHPCYRPDAEPCTCLQSIPAEAVAAWAENCIRPGSQTDDLALDDVCVLRNRGYSNMTLTSSR